MGNRRMGLGRMEALLEAVDRDLNLADSTLTNCTITTSQAGTFTGGLVVDGTITGHQREVLRQTVFTTTTELTVAQSGALVLLDTKYDNDYLVGGVTNLFDAAKTDGSTGGVAFVSAGGTDTTIILGDDNLANSGGGLGATVVLTAVLAGNTGAGGGAKLVWAVTGNKIAQAENDTGAAFFA